MLRRSVVLTAISLIAVAAGQTSRNITNENGRQQPTYDVIVVGAGLTGLTAARNIQQTRPGLSVLVLEARGQVGGKVRYATMQTRNGVEFVDTGSQFISPSDSELLSLFQQLNVRTFQQLTCGNSTVYQQTKRRKRQISLQQKWSTLPFADLVNSESEVGNSTNVSVATMSESLDVADADSVNRLMQTFFDAPGEQVAEVQLALTCSSQNATAVEILRKFGHGQSILAKGGMNEVVRRMADGLLIEYSQRVISVDDSTYPAIVQTSTGRNLTARQVILTVPIATLQNVDLIPTPENTFQELIENYGPTGHAYYFTMTFQRATWRLNGRSGKVIYTSASNGPLVWLTTFDTTFAASCANATSSSATLWGIAHFSYDVPFETRKKLYTSAITYSLRFADFSPLDVQDVNFATDDLARGTIPTLKLGIPFESLKYLADFHTLYQNVHIASADLASKSLGTMNGAVHAGTTVSNYVLQMLSAAETQNNGILRDAVETSTQFVYSTSSHYPPALFLVNETVNIVQNDQNEQDADFKYETSSQYPVTVAPPTTTTMKHFSFGNLDNSTSVVLYDSPQQSGQQKNTTFAYSTSSISPPIETIETTTFKHFSNGNLETTTENVQKVQRDQPLPVSQQSGFVYSTSTHYPISTGNGIDTNATPSPEVVGELQQVSDNAQNSSSIQLASQLNALVHSLLQQLRLQ